MMSDDDFLNATRLDLRPKFDRGPVPTPAPVTLHGLRLEALPWGKARGLGQNGGYLAAFDPADGRELWILKVYDIAYDPALEGDVQDRFIAGLAPTADGLLAVTDEAGGHWLVDVRRRAVVG